MESKLPQLVADFLPENFGAWSYPIDREHLPYAHGINYFTEGLPLGNLAKRNAEEARTAGLSETGFSVTKNGLYVGVIRIEGDKHDRLRFHGPGHLEQALRGETPPISGFYPRVEFPATGEHQYALLFMHDEDVFGTSHEVHELVAHANEIPFTIEVPDSVPAEKAVREALRLFSQGETFLREGRYTLKMELERLPIIAVRIDGYRPLNSHLQYEGAVRPELPVMGLMDLPLFYAKEVIGSYTGRKAPRSNPLERSVPRSDKYVEVPFTVAPGSGAALLGDVSLEWNNQAERAKLVYVALRRDESVAETAHNPYLGLVEVQVARGVKVNFVDIDFKPAHIGRKPEPRPSHRENHFGGEFITRGGGLTKGGGFFDYESSLGGNSFSTGKTILKDPKVGQVSPKVDLEWDGHLQTLRFCLTNSTT